MKNFKTLTWLRLAMGGAIVGSAVAGVFFGGGNGVEAAGAAVGGLSTAVLLKLLHFA